MSSSSDQKLTKAQSAPVPPVEMPAMNQPSLKDVTLVREHRMGNGSGNCDNGAAATADDKQALLDTEQVDSLAAELSPGSASAAQTEGRAASLVGQILGSKRGRPSWSGFPVLGLSNPADESRHSDDGNLHAPHHFNLKLLELVSSKLVLHDDDEKHVKSGRLSELVAKALRNRREKNFANEHTGSVCDRWKVIKVAGVFIRCAIPFNDPTTALNLGVGRYTLPSQFLYFERLRWVISFYVLLGANLATISFFIVLGRGFDVLSDPAMSYITDSCRWKMGRRRPFMMYGCIPYAISLIALLSPPASLSSDQLGIWFGVFYIIFFLLTTFTQIPYDALAPELTDNQDQRSKLYAACTVFDIFGSLFALVLPVALQGAFSGRTISQKSCMFPKNGTISLASCGMNFLGSSTLTEQQDCERWPMSGAAESLNYNTSLCDDLSVLVKRSTYEAVLGTTYDETASYCECIDACSNVFTLDNRRQGFMLCGFIFGSWAIVTMLNAVKTVKERGQLGNLPPPAPLVPSMVNTFQNKPFTLLLPAWVCDAVCNFMLLSMLMFYVWYVIEPEYSDDPMSGDSCQSFSKDEVPAMCKSELVVAAGGLSYLILGLIFAPVWLKLADKLGKRDTWLLWSLVTAITNFLLIFLGSGDQIGFVVVIAINGIPFGAKFLADAILADVIDYDEFLTGARSEATYTMFKSFLPKIASIPASAVPIALMGVFGHVPPVDGVVVKQKSTCLVPYIYVVTAVIPACLSLLAFVLKMRYPFKTKEQNESIAHGVSQLMLRLQAMCPISGTPYRLYTMTENMLKESFVLDAFMGHKLCEDLLADENDTMNKLLKKTTKQLVLTIVALVTSGGMVVGTWSLMDSDEGEDMCKTYGIYNGQAIKGFDRSFYNESTTWNSDYEIDKDAQCGVKKVSGGQDLSFIPVFAVVFFSVSITAVVGAYLRRKSAKELMANPIRSKTLNQMLKQRKLKLKCRNFKSKLREGCFNFCRKGKVAVMPVQRRLSIGYNDTLLESGKPQLVPGKGASMSMSSNDEGIGRKLSTGSVHRPSLASISESEVH